MKQSGACSRLSTHDYYIFIQVAVYLLWGETGYNEILTLKINLTLPVRDKYSPRQGGLNQGILHILSKCGHPSLKGL